MEKVDQAFIQYPQHRPNLTIIQPEHIPIIDLSPITNHTVSHPSPIEGLVKEIGNACKEWGFFQVINHGVSLTLRQNIEKASRLFFAQNLEEKRKVSKDENNTTGYHDREHLKNILGCSQLPSTSKIQHLQHCVDQDLNRSKLIKP